MKDFIVILIFLLISITTGYSQKRPVGTVKFGTDKYVDETEIDVASWLSFYTWTLIHEGYEVAQALLPDSNAIEPELWAYIKDKSTDYIDIEASYSLQPIGYFRKECKESAKFEKRLLMGGNYCALLRFPITGISYEQAVAFCKWRTRVQGGNRFIFRLPTPEEWKEFALLGLTESERRQGFKDSLYRVCANFNYKSVACCDENQGKLNGYGLYPPVKTGAYDIFGNVSEMTSEKGIAKGGNFTLYANQSHVDSIQFYTKPAIWLGFRCIAEKWDISKATPMESVKKEINFNADQDSKFGSFTDPRDGKTYPTVKIGNQTWLAANLAYKPASGKYWAYRNDEKYVDRYGYLYSWETAKNVCPAGWHLPSKEEFEELLYTVGGDEKTAYKELLPSGSSGLAIQSAGLRFDLDFTPIDGGSAFWSSTENGKRRAWGLTVGRLEPKVYVDDGWYKNYGLSVRCVKNE